MKDINSWKKVSDGDNKMFLQMTEVVERAWLDLGGMNLDGEMNTAVMISQVEKLLPPLQKREWALEHQQICVKGRCTFKDSLSFLRRERQAIEYISEDVRTEMTSCRKVNTVGVEYENVVEKDKVAQTELSEVKELIEGLAQVVKGMSYNYSRGNNERWNKTNGNNKSSRSCWYHTWSSNIPGEETWRFTI